MKSCPNQYEIWCHDETIRQKLFQLTILITLAPELIMSKSKVDWIETLGGLS